MDARMESLRQDVRKNPAELEREADRARDAVARRAEDNSRLAARNSALEAEVRDLKQGLAAAEERARTELGMIHSGETFYQIAPAPPAER